MKFIIAAVALTMGSPALAQSADPHAGHGTAHGTGKEQHQKHEDCCAKKADGARKACCDKAEDGKAMECCKKHQTGADAHAGHGMSKR
jgi:hypothetical protein